MTTNKKMPPSSLKHLVFFTFQTATRKVKVSQATFARWVKNGLIFQAGRNLYYHPEAKIRAETLHFVVACRKFGPKSAIAGLSALFHYRLVEQVPEQIWVLVPPSKISRNPLYRCIRSKTTIKHGIDTFDSYRITNLERTLVEAFKFATKIGPRIAIQASRTALKEGLTTEKKLAQMAENLKLTKVFRKYWESVVL